MSHESYDVIIRRGTVFDGNGTPGVIADVGIQGSVVRAISETPLVPGPETKVIDAEGRWVTPGFLDIHSHYDAELEIAPELIESVRHGVTTVLTGSCSLSMAMGNPTDLADMFCRVEGIPRSVVKPLFERIKTWDSPREYMDHLEQIPLGPNAGAMLGHSTMRAAAMGMDRALDKRVKPTSDELTQMDTWLAEALDCGYAGMSISTLPWDKMDGQEFRSRPMPSVFARWSEYRHFFKTLRRRGKVLQGVPNVTTKINVILFLLASAGVFRPTLKTTMISMMDIKADRYAFRLAGLAARIFNTLLGANVKMQALPVMFDLWADGIDLVVFEEFEAGMAALHMQDAVSRADLLDDPQYRARFKKQWRNKWLPRAYHRNFRHSEVLECPDETVVGKSFAQIAAERGQDVEDVFLDLCAAHGKKMRWYTIMGNDRPDWLRWIVSHEDIIIGFSDAGAHLRNMAHYNFPLRLLQMVRDAQLQGREFMTVERAVQRLTSEIADWFDLPVGRLAVGHQADVVVIDPEKLDARMGEIHEDPMPGFPGLNRLVRRNDDTVEAVLIAGRLACTRGQASDDLGKTQHYGRVLRAGEPPAQAGEALRARQSRRTMPTSESVAAGAS